MTADRPGPGHSVPTLTEVVSVPGPAREVPAAPPADVRDAVPPAWPGEEALVRQVLAEVQRQVDGVLEYRVREILTPILTRATDAVVREARHELARSLRDVVSQCVAQELQRQRTR